MHRLTIQYDAPADPPGFDRRYDEEHVPLVRGLPGLARFTLSRPRGLHAPAPYLVAELWFDSAEVMKEAMRSPEMAETAAHAERLGVPMTMFSGDVVDHL